MERHSSVSADFPSGQGLGMRRVLLHQRMVERAGDCGVSLLWNAPVTGISEDGATAGGRQIRARWIVGADGSQSQVRRWSGLERTTQKDQRIARRRHYGVKPWLDFAEIHWGADAQAYVTPVSKEEVCVVLISAKAGAGFEGSLRQFPELSRRVAWAPSVSPERGAMTSMHSLKRVYRGNVALIGDASGSVDAITGEGLCLAFSQAAALAEALEAGDLARYQKAHRILSRRPKFMGNLMLWLAAKRKLRKRAMLAMQEAPDVFARMLAFHVGEASVRQMVSAAASLGLWLLAA